MTAHPTQEALSLRILIEDLSRKIEQDNNIEHLSEYQSLQALIESGTDKIALFFQKVSRTPLLPGQPNLYFLLGALEAAMDCGDSNAALPILKMLEKLIKKTNPKTCIEGFFALTPGIVHPTQHSLQRLVKMATKHDIINIIIFNNLFEKLLLIKRTECSGMLSNIIALSQNHLGPQFLRYLASQESEKKESILADKTFAIWILIEFHADAIFTPTYQEKIEAMHAHDSIKTSCFC